jgi:hypothetical protein
MAFCFHPILRHNPAARFNRRMRKTACPVVWEGDGAQSPSLDLIPPVGLCGTTREAGQGAGPTRLAAARFAGIFRGSLGAVAEKVS